MPFGIHLGGKRNNQPDPLWSQPPTASDGYETYINKMLARSGVLGRDDFRRTQPGGGQGGSRGDTLNTVLKWAGIAFAGALGLLGIKSFLGRKAAQTAQTVVTTVSK